MRLLISLLLIIGFHTVTAHTQTCYTPRRTEGIAFFTAKNYAQAITAWQKAIEDCSDLPSNHDLNEWIKKAQDSIALPPSVSISEPDMVEVQGDTFTMGSIRVCKNCITDEFPAHSVRLNTFFIGKFEVTQAQWRWVMGSNYRELYIGDCDNCPVNNLNWNDTQEFIQKLNQKTGKKYRLPTEAEWEYAAKGGNKSKGFIYSGSNSVEEVAWCDYYSLYKAQFVGSKKPNELGLYDMSGNVWEWCKDWYDKKYYKDSPKQNPQGAATGIQRVLRGSSWRGFIPYCSTSSRFYNFPSNRVISYGFRLARD